MLLTCSRTVTDVCLVLLCSDGAVGFVVAYHNTPHFKVTAAIGKAPNAEARICVGYVETLTTITLGQAIFKPFEHDQYHQSVETVIFSL